MRRIKGAYSGENIIEVAVPVLQEYRVVPNLGIFITDNAELNDIAIRYILVAI